MPYHLSGEKKKCEKITSHLCRRLSIFHVLFLLCIIFWVASFKTDRNFLWGQTFSSQKKKREIVIKIMKIL